MSRGCALLISGSKVKITMHWLMKMVNLAELLPHYTYHREPSYKDSPWVVDVPYGFWGPKVKATALITENSLSHNCFLFTKFTMKLHTKTPHELRMYHIDFWFKESKVKVTINWLLKMVNITYINLFSLYTYHHETSYKYSPWVEDMPYWSQGQRSGSQCRFVKMGFGALLLYLYTYNHETPHTDPHESRICPIDFAVKVTMQWFLKMFLLHIALSSHQTYNNETPHESRYYWGKKLGEFELVAPGGIFPIRTAQF